MSIYLRSCKLSILFNQRYEIVWNYVTQILVCTRITINRLKSMLRQYIRQN